MYGKRATVGRPYGRVVSRNDGEVAIEKIKKPPLRRLSRQLPSRGAVRDVGVPFNTNEICVGEGEPLLEERCHGVTERWRSRK